jgi:hypothetical protein
MIGQLAGRDTRDMLLGKLLKDNDVTSAFVDRFLQNQPRGAGIRRDLAALTAWLERPNTKCRIEYWWEGGWHRLRANKQLLFEIISGECKSS